MIYLPVHNVGVGGGTPDYHLEPPLGLGFRLGLTNYEAMKNVAEGMKKGRNKLERYKGMIWFMDSSGFAIFKGKRKWDEEWARDVVHLAERLGIPYVFSLDAPEVRTDHYATEGRNLPTMVIVKTVEGIVMALMEAKRTKVFGVLQYATIEDLKKQVELLRLRLKQECLDEGKLFAWAIGGMGQIKNFQMVVKHTLMFYRVLGHQRVHFLGKGGLILGQILGAMGVFSSDSSFYIQMGGRKRCFKSDLRRLICTKAKDRKATTMQVIAMTVRTLARAVPERRNEILKALVGRRGFRPAIELVKRHEDLLPVEGDPLHDELFVEAGAYNHIIK